MKDIDISIDGISEFISKLSSEDKILVLGHMNADVDALTSSFAMSSYLQKKGFESKVSFSKAVNANAVKFAKQLGLEYSVDPDLNEFNKIFLMDFSGPEMLGDLVLPKGIEFVVMDHHKPNDEFVSKAKCSLVDTTASATCILVYKLFSKTNVEVDGKTAKMIAAGIFVDTMELSMADADSFEILGYCLNIANIDMTKLRLMLEIKHDISSRMARLEGINNTKFYFAKDFLVGITEVKPGFESACVQALVNLGVDFGIAYSKGEKGRLLLRLSDDAVFNKELSLSEKNIPPVMDRNDCGGGGHPNAGGARCSLEVLDKVVKELFDEVKNNLSDEYNFEELK